MSAWSTAAKTNFEKAQRLQNQAARIIKGALGSTSINRIECITGFQPMEDRRTGRVLQQGEKLKRLTEHPMHHRIRGFGRGRLKKNNFVALAKGDIRKHEALARPAAVSLTAKKNPLHLVKEQRFLS
jgi:hypothetical protein